MGQKNRLQNKKKLAKKGKQPLLQTRQLWQRYRRSTDTFLLRKTFYYVEVFSSISRVGSDFNISLQSLEMLVGGLLTVITYFSKPAYPWGVAGQQLELWSPRISILCNKG